MRSWAKLRRLAVEEIEATLASLPAPLRDRAEILPVTLEHRPNMAQRREGIQSDVLGLFVGAEFADQEEAGLPPQIILFFGEHLGTSGRDRRAISEGNPQDLPARNGTLFGL